MEEVKTKVCSRCKRVLPLTEFGKGSGNKDGLQRWCKECHFEYRLKVNPNTKHRKHYESDKPEEKTCHKCGLIKPLDSFNKNKTEFGGLSNWCKECNLEYQHSRKPNSKYREKYICEPGKKYCSVCKTQKSVIGFSKNKNIKDGLSRTCKDCVREYYLSKNQNRKHRKKKRTKIGFKICSKCGMEKPFHEFGRKPTGVFGLNSLCKKCVNENRREYRKNNEEKVKEFNKKSYLKSSKHKPQPEKVKILCKQCGNMFEVSPCRDYRQFCSTECYQKYSVGENNGFYGKTHSLKFREQMKNLKLGSADSEETKNKKRIANLKRYEDPKEHERTSAANKKRFEDPRQREIQRINQLKAFEEHPEIKEKSIRTLKTLVKTEKHKRNIGLALRGEKNGCWKGGITKLDVQIRSCTKMKLWRLGVLKRDNYADAFSGVKGTQENPVDVHHYIKFSILMEKYNIKSLEESEACEELWDLDNGVTILKSTHDKHHYKWGL
jgi:hypothetical protein